MVHSASATAVFRCQFSNWDGSDDKTFSVIVTGISGGIVAVIVIVSIIILIFIVLIGVFLKSTYKHNNNNIHNFLKTWSSKLSHFFTFDHTRSSAVHR